MISCDNCININTTECHFCLDDKGEEIILTRHQTKIPRKSRFLNIATEIGNLVDEKNAAYGDSVNTSAEAFKLLYPNGIKIEQYSDALLLVRIWDKMKRIATRKDAFGESPFEDISGYSLLGAEKDKRQ